MLRRRQLQMQGKTFPAGHRRYLLNNRNSSPPLQEQQDRKPLQQRVHSPASPDLALLAGTQDGSPGLPEEELLWGKRHAGFNFLHPRAPCRPSTEREAEVNLSVSGQSTEPALISQNSPRAETHLQAVISSGSHDMTSRRGCNPVLRGETAPAPFSKCRSL